MYIGTTCKIHLILLLIPEAAFLSLFHIPTTSTSRRALFISSHLFKFFFDFLTHWTVQYNMWINHDHVGTLVMCVRMVWVTQTVMPVVQHFTVNATDLLPKSRADIAHHCWQLVNKDQRGPLEYLHWTGSRLKRWVLFFVILEHFFSWTTT